ncbi:MAG: DUF1845 domain-containing protein, partial [Chloroflexi bacterium]|nr:DUF1845 domain-containing protein [Chloroflexota bacterium]
MAPADRGPAGRSDAGRRARAARLRRAPAATAGRCDGHRVARPGTGRHARGRRVLRGRAERTARDRGGRGAPRRAGARPQHGGRPGAGNAGASRDRYRKRQRRSPGRCSRAGPWPRSAGRPDGRRGRRRGQRLAVGRLGARRPARRHRGCQRRGRLAAQHRRGGLRGGAGWLRSVRRAGGAVRRDGEEPRVPDPPPPRADVEVRADRHVPRLARRRAAREGHAVSGGAFLGRGPAAGGGRGAAQAVAVNGLYRARLRTIAARQLWDGRRPAPGRVAIPGVRDFQRGVRALRAAAESGETVAAARLEEIDAALDATGRALGRWRRGLAAYVATPPDPEPHGVGKRWLGATRLVGIRAPQTRRLARLLVDYDALCALCVAATAAAGGAGTSNTQHVGIRNCGRSIRAVVHAGAAARARRGRRGRRPAVRPAGRGPGAAGAGAGAPGGPGARPPGGGGSPRRSPGSPG